MSLPDDFQHRPWFDSPPWWCPIHCPKPDNVRFRGIILRAYVCAFVFVQDLFLPCLHVFFSTRHTARPSLAFLFVHPRDNKESRQVEIAQFHLSWEAKEVIQLKLQFGKLGGTSQDKHGLIESHPTAIGWWAFCVTCALVQEMQIIVIL